MKGALALLLGGIVAWWLLADEAEPASPPENETPAGEEAAMPGPELKPTSYGRVQLEQLAVDCAIVQGATPAVLLAHCDIETYNWDYRATNLTGGDMRRGGAYGCPQITLRTARTLDDRIRTSWSDIDPARGGAALLDYPELAFALAAAAVAENESRVRADGGSISDVAALYNSGRYYAAAPSSTHAYVQKFLKAYELRTGSREWS